jgi:hypothetical protein
MHIDVEVALSRTPWQPIVIHYDRSRLAAQIAHAAKMAQGQPEKGQDEDFARAHQLNWQMGTLKGFLYRYNGPGYDLVW